METLSLFLQILKVPFCLIFDEFYFNKNPPMFFFEIIK